MGDSDAQYEFSSPPTVPREKVGDVLVKFQAVSATNPCLLVKSYRLNSNAKVLDIRRKIQSEFDKVFENGFVFLCKNTEILTSRERTLTLRDVLPKAGLGKPFQDAVKNSFLYPSDTPYKQLLFEKDGRSYRVTCIGLLFLCDASGVSHWNPKELRQRLDAHSTFGFSSIPSDITSARTDVNESQLEELNQYAAVSRLENKKQTKDADESEDQKKSNYEICKEKIEQLLKSSGIGEEKMKDRTLATPLHHAAAAGHIQMCQFLCIRNDKGKLLYEKDMYGRTALHCALSRIGVKSSKKHLKVVAYLLTYISDSDTLHSNDENGLSCYNMILRMKTEDTIVLMKMLDPDHIDQKLVLHFCCCALQYRQLSEAARYCESVPSVNPTFIRPPMHLAAEYGNEEIITKLKTSFQKVSKPDPDGHLPFHYACQHGKVEFIKYLYEKNMTKEDLEKGIRIALYSKNYNVLEEIVENAEVIDLSTELCEILVIQAELNLKKHGKSILGCLMKASDKQKEQNISLLSPFVSQAASLGLTDLLKDLLMICPPKYKDVMSRTPLHEAVQGVCFSKKLTKTSKRQGKCLEAFKILLHETKSLKVVDCRCSTPLHYACMDGNLEFIKFMLSQKDLEFASQKDSVGRTPLLIAAHYQNGRKALEFLINEHLEHMDPYALDMYGKSILHYIGHMKPGIVDTLLDKMRKLKDISSGPFKPLKFSHPRLNSLRTINAPSWMTEFINKDVDDVKHCRYCDDVLYEESGTHFCQFYFQTLPANEDLSPAETLVVMNKPDILKKLIKEMPASVKGDNGLKATFCAVRMWRCECAELLLKGPRKESNYLDKYLLAALERKPTEVWDKEDQHPRKCRLARLRTKSDLSETKRQFFMVEVLLKMGANPCYLPPQRGYQAKAKHAVPFFTSNEFGSFTNPPRLNTDIPCSLRRYCTALEKAIIMENEDIVDLLLQKSKIHVNESFATHLAAKAGNVELLKKLLQKLKKDQLRGKAMTELAFVSTLQNGILGAACMSESPSFAMFEAIYQIAPEVLKGTKLITAKLLENTRPVMLEILRIHNILPLILLMRRRHQNLSSSERERIVCFILQHGSYPVEMRIKKTSFIHPACELLSTAHSKIMWKVAAILLQKSGTTLWKCLFGVNDDKIKCHSRLYSHKSHEAFRQRKDWYHSQSETAHDLRDLLRHYTNSPIQIVSMFTYAGLRTLTTLDQHVKEDLLEEFNSNSWTTTKPMKKTEEEGDETKPGEEEPPKDIQKLFLELIIPQMWIKPMKHLLSPHIRPRKRIADRASVNGWIPIFVNCETTSLAHLQSVQDVLKKPFPQVNIQLLEQLIHVRNIAMFKKEKDKYKTLERRLIQMLKSTRQADRDLPSLWYAVAYGHCDLVDHIIRRKGSDILFDEEGERSLLDLAARKADLPMVKLLIKHGDVPTDLTLQYAGLNRCCFLEGYNMMPHFHDPGGQKQYRTMEEEDKIRLDLVKYLCERFFDTDQAFSPRYTEVLRKAAGGNKWNLVDFLVDTGVTVLDLTNVNDIEEDGHTTNYKPIHACKALQKIVSDAPNDLVLKALQTTRGVKWNQMTLYLILATAARVDRTAIMKYLLLDVLFRSPSPLDSPGDILDLLIKPAVHGYHYYRECVFHSLCQNGDIDSVKIILTNLKCENVHFIDFNLNHSSPLWYALAEKHWTLAEFLLMNGAAPFCHRAVPDFNVKRTGYSLPQKKTRITSVKQFPGRCNNSSEVATAMKSRSDLFLKPKALMKLKQKSELQAHISQTTFKKRRSTTTPGAQRVKVLMNMAQFGKSLKGTIFHAAMIEGDIALMKEIQSQPMFETMMKTSEGTSAAALALSSQSIKIVKDIRRYLHLMGDPMEIIRKACQVIISLLNNTLSEILKLLYPKWKDKSVMEKSEETKQQFETEMKPIMHSLYDTLVSNYSEGRKLRPLSFERKMSLEDLVKEIIGLLSLEQKVPDELLLALALLCNPNAFTALEEKLKTSTREKDVTSRVILEGCTVTDLIVLLNSQKEMKQICHSLEVLSSISVLHISDKVLMYSLKRNMTSVLRVIAESISKKNPERLLSKRWLEVFVHAAYKGDNVLLKLLMKVFAGNVIGGLDDAVGKALCVSSSKGYSDIVEALLTFAAKRGISKTLDIHAALKEAAKYGRAQVVKQLFKVCQKTQQLNIDLLIKILKRTKFNGSRTFFQTVFDFGQEIFRAEKEKIAGEVATVLLQSAKRGHEQLCLYLLENFTDVDIKKKSNDRKKEITVKGQTRFVNQDNKEATTLHYACERGSKKLVLKILEKDSQLAKLEDRDKRNPIAYAVAMGEVAILREVSVQFNITSNETFQDDITYCGSLRYFLTKNAEGTSKEGPGRLYATITPSRQSTWTLWNAMKYRDEEAALSMFYAAEGQLLHEMKNSYSGLVHKASGNGCVKVLTAIFKCFENDTDSLQKILETEVGGYIPLALAVQCKSTDCVKLLKEKHDATAWVSSTTTETIFHVAAQANDAAILDILLENTDPQRVFVPDAHGMTAGIYSIALGHHQLVSRFFQLGYPENPQHSSHEEINFTCHECLLDRCFGWSKMYLDQRQVTQSTNVRDIWERPSTAGFTSDRGTKSHVLETLLEYVNMTKNASIVKNALICMGYQASVDTARLFLLQSTDKKQHVGKVRQCLSQRWQSTTITLLKHLDKKEDEDFYFMVLDSAIAMDSKEVVKYMIQEHPRLIYSRNETGFTAIEVAISLQRYDIYDKLLSQVPQDALQDCFKNLSDVKVCIPLQARLLAEITCPGDETWLESIQESRLPEANCLMLYNNDTKLKQKLESTCKLDSMFPESIVGKSLRVDTESFKRSTPIPVSDSWLMVMVSSYLHYLKPVLEEGSQLDDVDVVEVSCLPSSNKTPFMEVSGRTLRDRVKLEKSDSSTMKDPVLCIQGSERLPNKFHRDSYFKKLVETEMIPDAEKLAAAVVGHKVKVKVDWPSFNAEHTEAARTTVYNILAGRDPHSSLGGLMDVLQRCMVAHDDILALHCDETMNSIQELFSPLREIVVKHSNSVSKASKILFCLIDQSMNWFVSYKNDDLSFIASNFPLYNILKACHSVCVNMSPGLHEFETEVERRMDNLPPDEKSHESDKTKGNKQEQKSARIELHIDWKSFGSLGDTTSLSVLGRNGLRLEMLRLAAGLKHLMWYNCRPKHLIIKSAPLASQTDLSMDGETATIAIYTARSHNAGWISTGLDIYSQLQEIEIKWLLDNFSFENTESLIELPEVNKKFGLNISILHEEKKWLEEIVRKENRQMIHPEHLLQLYLLHCLLKESTSISSETKLDTKSVDNSQNEVEKSTVTSVASSEGREEKSRDSNKQLKKKYQSEQKREKWQMHDNGLAEELEKSISWCPGIWPIKEQDIIPGLWLWVTTAELQNGISFDNFLVKVKEKDGNEIVTAYKVMTKQNTRALDAQRVSGVWYHQPFQKRRDKKSVKRLQLISFSGMIYHIADPFTLHELLLKIPSKIKMGLSSNEVKEDDKTFFVEFGSWVNGFNMHSHLNGRLQRRTYVDTKALHDCWNRCSELGINVVIDTEDFRESGIGNIVFEQIAEGTATSVERFVQKTELITQSLCSSLLSSVGVLRVGATNYLDEKTPWIAEGSSNDDKYFTICPLSETDIFVSYEKVLTCIKESVERDTFPHISSVYTKVLNKAFGHKAVKIAKSLVSKALQDVSTPRGSTTEVVFLEPTTENSFIPQAQIVLDNITTACGFAASVSRVVKERLARNVKEVHIKKTNNDFDLNTVKYQNEILTIFAVKKDTPFPLEVIAKAMLTAFGVEISSLNGEVRRDKFFRFKPVGYMAVCPKQGQNTFHLKLSDALGMDVSEERLKKFKLKHLKVILKEDFDRPVESKVAVISDGQRLEIDCKIPANSGYRKNEVVNGVESYLNSSTVSIQLEEKILLGPMGILNDYSDPSGVIKGMAANQIVLTEESKPKFFMLPKHDYICWGTYHETSSEKDNCKLPGNCVEKIDTPGVTFEITYAGQFRRSKKSKWEGETNWFEIRSARQPGRKKYMDRIHSFQFLQSRERIFIRARCRQCTSFMDLHTKVVSVPAGQHLEVLCAPSTPKDGEK